MGKSPSTSAPLLIGGSALDQNYFLILRELQYLWFEQGSVKIKCSLV
jgi:hypothetical protein